MGGKARHLVLEVEKHLKELAEETDAAKQSDLFNQYITVMSRFHKYSFYNQYLIFCQMPGATLVAGYRTWQKMGRYVMKGEKSIRILAPGSSKQTERDEDTGDEVERIVNYFFSVSVFDISQTDGDPIPIPKHRVEGDNWRPFLDSLISLCEAENIAIDFSSMGWGILGASYGGKVEINNEKSINGQVGTTIHEIAHEMLHKNGDGGTKQKRELEAEAVTHVVLKHFHLDSKSSNYMAMLDADYKMMMEFMKVVSAAVGQIIAWIEKSVDFKEAA